MILKDFALINDLKDRFQTLRTIPGGMGVVHIALDRAASLILSQVDDNILKKCIGISPENLSVEGDSLVLSEADRCGLAMHMALGLLTVARDLRNRSVAAVKVIHPKLSSGRVLSAFRFEARLWLEIPSRSP